MKPLLRHLLLRLRGQNPASYERGVERYRSEVETVEDGTEALAAWLSYGAWLASEIAPGRLVTVSETGRAEPAPDPLPRGPMLMHLPEDAKRRGFVIAMPASPSDAQSATAALLCERKPGGE